MKPEHNNREQIYEEALKFLEEGTPMSELAGRFPKHAEELNDLVVLLSAIRNAGAAARPNAVLLQRVIDRSSPRAGYHLPFLRMGWLVPAGFAVLLLVGLLSSRAWNREEQTFSSGPVDANAEATMVVTEDPFDLAAMDRELARAASLGDELNVFLAEEESLRQVDAEVMNF